MKRATRRAFLLAYAAWLLGIVAFFVPAATWNPVSRFNLTRAIVERGTLNVDPYVSSTGDRAFQQALYACSLSTSGLGAIALALLGFVFLCRRTTPRAAFLGSSLVLLGS